MAMGGSTNTVLHTLALAREAGVDYSLGRINEVAARTLHLCKVSPSGKWHMEDVDRAGGICCNGNLSKHRSRSGRCLTFSITR